MQSKSKTNAIKNVLVFAFAFFCFVFAFFLVRFFFAFFVRFPEKTQKIAKKPHKKRTTHAKQMQTNRTKHAKHAKIAQKRWCVKFGYACAFFLHVFSSF